MITNFKILKTNQSGQAVMEYILVMIVIVGIAQVLYQFNVKFREWAEDYFIAYYQCLLETGELPSLGGQDGSEGLCNQEYKPFTWAEGRGLLTNGGKGGDGSGNSGTSGSDSGSGSQSSNPNDGTADNNSDKDRGAEVSGVAGSGGGAGSGRNNRFKSSDNDKGSAADGGEGAGSKKKAYTGSTKTMNVGGNGNTGAKKKQNELDRGFGLNKKKEKRGEEKSNVSVKQKGGGNLKKAERFLVKRSIATRGEEVEDEGFSLGVFLRFLIIAAIIIALVMLIGGQVLQVTKGLDSD